MDKQENVYQRLRREIDKLPIPYPETKSGVEIKLLKHLFKPAEAEIAVNLNILPENLKRIHKRVKKNGINISAGELEEKLDTLVKKGSIIGGRYYESKGKGKIYSLAPLAIGMFENQIDRLTKEFARDFERYMKENFSDEVVNVKTVQMRTVPVNTSITPERRVEPYMDMREYVKNIKDDITVTNCVCRQSNDVTGHKCKHSNIRETCLQFHDSARHVLGLGVARKITNEEALAIMDRAEKAGFIFNPQNSQEPQFLCCCDGDCCHVLRALKMYPRPAEMIKSNYYMVIDAAQCKGCKKCVEKCPMDAISMKDKTAMVNLDRCIGCGVCAAPCKNNAHMLRKKENTQVPPKNHDALYQKIMTERFGTGRVLTMAAKYMAGLKA
ncbi:MAG: 4Fe-4S binding protein [Spirochaetes bacterium]|nr:4Fe-4S binding protein [Spirochaetota bacterium]